MSDLTVDPTALTSLAGFHSQAAAESQIGVEATESVDLSAKLYETHGVISGPSNNAVKAMARTREEAGNVIEQACLTLAAALTEASALYTGTDQNAADAVDDEMPT